MNGTKIKLFPISVEGVWGYIDETGKLVIAPKFLSANHFSEGLAKVEIAGTSEEDLVFKRTYQGFIDPTGKWIVPPRPPEGVEAIKNYDTYSYSDFHEGLANIHINDASGMAGYIDQTGKIVISPSYSPANDFSDGLAYVETWNPWDQPGPKRKGFINRQGEFVIENESFAYSSGFSDSRAPVTLETEHGTQKALINLSGEFVISPGTYESVGFPVGGAIRVCNEGQVGMVDMNGNLVIALGEYDQILEPTNGEIFVAEKNGKSFLVDSTGKHLAEVNGDVFRFSDGLAAIENENQFGFIDATGKIKIPLQFDQAESFQNGLALVTQGEFRGYINSDGEFVWKTDCWETPLINSVSQPLSDYLPTSTLESMPLSYNWGKVENAIVFATDLDLKTLADSYKTKCIAPLELTDFTNEYEPDQINLMINAPDHAMIEVFATEGEEHRQGFLDFYFCENMTLLAKKHPGATIGILIQN